ncbi:MAG: hypothetical protein OHK0017_08120 [Patescibacteria group bacterium]
MLSWFKKLPLWGKILAGLFLWPILVGLLIWKIPNKNVRFASLAIWVIFVISGFAVSGSEKPTQKPVTEKPVETKTVAGEQEKTNSSFRQVKESKEPTPEELSAQAEEKRKPDLDISGEITPTVATRGEKVVIKVNVENKDKTKTINGVRLKFLNSDFINKGLVIVNVIGGRQDGDQFIFDTPLMTMAPGEKRVLNIVANAKEAGSYESTIMTTPILGQEKYTEFNFPDGKPELVASLKII